MLASIFADSITSLWSAKQRTLLATIGIVIGSGSVIAMINVGQMVQAEALSQFQKMGPNIINLGLSGETKSVTPEAVQALARTLPGEPLTAPFSSTHTNWIYAHKQGDVNIVAADEIIFEIASVKVKKGRYINHLDGYAPFALLGADALRPRGQQQAITPRLGDELQLGGTFFQIVGELQPYGNNPLLGFDLDNTLFVPLKAILRLGVPLSIQSILLKSPPSADVSAVGAQAKRYLEDRFHGLTVDVQLAEQAIAEIKQQSRLLSLLLGTMGSISLLVGGIGIMNVMLVSVAERRREIGLRLAVGARPSNIVTLFLMEAAILTTLGGILGLGLGSIIAILVGHFSGTPYFFSPLAALLGIGVSAIIGIFFGFYPAHLASQLNPIEALDAE